MSEKALIAVTFCTLLTLFVVFLLISGYLTFLNTQQKSLTETVETLKNEKLILEGKLNETQFKLLTRPNFYDEPTEVSPRMVSNGVFMMENSQFLSNEMKTEGRKKGDLENVAVLINVSNQNDTERWINDLKSQRKSRKDLHIFLFSSNIDNKVLKSLSRHQIGVTAISPAVANASIFEVFHRRHKDYAILINDFDHIGADFADFYFLGKTVMEFDNNIGVVCGGSNEKWQNSEMGDVFWLSDAICERGIMLPKVSNPEVSSFVSLRPEVARVGKFEKSVTDSSWEIDKFYPSILKLQGFEMRLEYDLGNAEKLPKHLWNTLSLEDPSKIYMFPYVNRSELEEYLEGERIEDVHMYKGIVPLNKGNFKVYLVPEFTYEKRMIRDNFGFS